MLFEIDDNNLGFPTQPTAVIFGLQVIPADEKFCRDLECVPAGLRDNVIPSVSSISLESPSKLG